jgi:nitrogen fixation protein FixH
MRELTGRKVFAITAGFFGVVIAVNGVLAWKAVQTFPGLEVPNSYVASQTWDAERAAQVALGWSLSAGYDHEAEALQLDFTDASGQPAPLMSLSVLVGRPTEAKDDQWPVLTLRDGIWEAPLSLAPGKWMLKVEARAEDGTLFKQRLDLFVKG